MINAIEDKSEFDYPLFISEKLKQLILEMNDDDVDGSDENDEKRAFKLVRKPAKNRNSESQFHLSIMYGKGEGTEKNLEMDFYWYQKAVENGYDVAQNSLAILYEKGEGTEKNLERAFYWYKKVAENEDNLA